jgi:hypothetical protein
MKQTDPPHESARSAWQSIGEILLPVDSDGREAIHPSLQECLAPLHLPTDFIHRVAKSLDEILQRAVTKQTGLEHIHLFLYLPANYSAQMGSWGFFRIERIHAGGAQGARNHAVDLYLYPE